MNTDNKELYKFLYGTASWKNGIEAMFTSDFKGCRSHNDVMKVYNKYVPYLVYGRAFNTMLRMYTDFRSIITELNTKNTEFALEVAFSLNKKDDVKGVYAYKSMKHKKMIDKKDDVLKDGSKGAIKSETVLKFFNHLKDTIDNDDFSNLVYKTQKVEQVKAYYITILLGLCTGRRMVEILKTINISIKKGVPMFSGFVKKSPDDDKPSTGVILFITPTEAKKYLSMLRKLIDVSAIDNKDINKKYNAVFNNALVKYSSDILGATPFLNNKGVLAKISFHDLRKIYAGYAYKEFGNGGDTSMYYQKVLNVQEQLTGEATYRMSGLVE